MSNKHYAAQRYSLFNHPMKGRIQPKDVTKHLAKGSGASFPSFGVHAANFISLFPICFFFFFGISSSEILYLLGHSEAKAFVL